MFARLCICSAMFALHSIHSPIHYPTIGIAVISSHLISSHLIACTLCRQLPLTDHCYYDSCVDCSVIPSPLQHTDTPLAAALPHRVQSHLLLGLGFILMCDESRGMSVSGSAMLQQLRPQCRRRTSYRLMYQSCLVILLLLPLCCITAVTNAAATTATLSSITADIHSHSLYDHETSNSNSSSTGPIPIAPSYTPRYSYTTYIAVQTMFQLLFFFVILAFVVHLPLSLLLQVAGRLFGFEQVNQVIQRQHQHQHQKAKHGNNGSDDGGRVSDGTADGAMNACAKENTRRSYVKSGGAGLLLYLFRSPSNPSHHLPRIHRLMSCIDCNIRVLKHMQQI